MKWVGRWSCWVCITFYIRDDDDDDDEEEEEEEEMKEGPNRTMMNEISRQMVGFKVFFFFF